MTDPDTAVEILLAENNPDDIALATKALEQSTLTSNLHVVTDGVETREFLTHEGEYANAPRPALILLDLEMPRKDGRAVLEELEADDDLRRIPVVVVTSSEAETDVAKSYERNANAYVIKPVDVDGFCEIVNRVANFWFEIVTLPETER